MQWKVLLLAMLAMLLICPLAKADTIVSGTGSWFPIGDVTLNQNGIPFWDQLSNDGSNLNVGFLLNTPDPSKGLPVPNLEFLATSTYDVVNNVYLNGLGSGQVETLLFTIAGNASQNILSAYNVADPSQTTTIFSGPSGAVVPPVITVAIDIPYTQWGLMLTGPGGTFYSQVDPAGAAMSDDMDSNFAFFRNAALPGTWWIGVEDLRNPISRECNGDYNDMVIKISTVPLPPSALLLGSGLLGLALMGYRRRKS